MQNIGVAHGNRRAEVERLFTEDVGELAVVVHVSLPPPGR